MKPDLLSVVTEAEESGYQRQAGCRESKSNSDCVPSFHLEFLIRSCLGCAMTCKMSPVLTGGEEGDEICRLHYAANVVH